MSLWKNYHIAQSVEDAIQTLTHSQGDSRIIAGGTDLLLDLQQGRHPPVHTLVDVTEIPELRKLEIRDRELFIGAGVPHRRITESTLVRDHAQALAEASGLIGGPQVRNTATLGGNVAHALPAADGTIALLALDAQAEVAGLDGRRRILLSELFLGPGKSALKDEVLVGFYLNLRNPGEGSAFERVMRPQGVAIAILNLSVWVRRNGDTVADIRIAVGPSGPVPLRMAEAENIFRQKELTDEVIFQACRAILGEASLRTSKHRATKEYRQKMSGFLLEETLMAAFKRAARSR